MCIDKFYAQHSYHLPPALDVEARLVPPGVPAMFGGVLSGGWLKEGCTFATLTFPPEVDVLVKAPPLAVPPCALPFPLKDSS